MQNVPAVAVPLDPLASYIYIQHKNSRTSLQPRPSFASTLPLYNIFFSIIDHFSSNVSFYEEEDFIALFHGWGSSSLRLQWEPAWGGSLLFTIKFPEIPCTHFLSTSEGQAAQINTEVWFKERSIGPYIDKMLFSQVDQGFWIY